MIQLGDLVGLEVAGDGNFSGLTASLASDEPPPMVDAAILNLFIQSKVCFLFHLFFFGCNITDLSVFFFFYIDISITLGFPLMG